MKNQFIIFLILITLSACNQTTTLNKSEKEQIVHDIVKMFDDYHNDIKKDGLTAEFKYLDQSTDFFWVPPGYKNALSYDSVRTILNKNATSFRAIEFSWDTLQIFPLSYKFANYSGIVKGSMTDTSGIKSSIAIIESGTLVKRSDGWKLLNGQSAVLEPDLKEKQNP